VPEHVQIVKSDAEGVLSSRSFLQMLSESKKSMSKKHMPWESHARFLGN